MLSTQNKLLYPIFGTLVFILASNNTASKLIEKMFAEDSIIKNNCPTIFGHFVQSIMFFILMLVIMLLLNSQQSTFWTLTKYAFYGTLLYFILTTSEMYGLMAAISGGSTSDSFGCPTQRGVILHALIYFFIMLGIMGFS